MSRDPARATLCSQTESRASAVMYSHIQNRTALLSSDYNHKEGTLTITDTTTDMTNWTRDKVATINRGCGAAPVGFHANDEHQCVVLAMLATLPPSPSFICPK